VLETKGQKREGKSGNQEKAFEVEGQKWELNMRGAKRELEGKFLPFFWFFLLFFCMFCLFCVCKEKNNGNALSSSSMVL
jgi:hypothetical protein